MPTHHEHLAACDTTICYRYIANLTAPIRSRLWFSCNTISTMKLVKRVPHYETANRLPWVGYLVLLADLGQTPECRHWPANENAYYLTFIASLLRVRGAYADGNNPYNGTSAYLAWLDPPLIDVQCISRRYVTKGYTGLLPRIRMTIGLSR